MLQALYCDPIMLDLTSDKRSELRARAHALHPVVMIGDAGLVPSVLGEIDRNLSSHELIKIRVFSDEHEQRAAMLSEICNALAAAPVQHIGKILVVYRPRTGPAEPAVRKARPRPKPARRTKRSFQG